VFRRAATIGAALAMLGGAVVLAPTAGATSPCPVEYCTESNGEYVLTVPPLTGKPGYEGLADCIWKVRVDFGDKTEQEYVFDASVGLSGSHLFPSPGYTYTVRIELREGHHGQSEGFCLDYTRYAEVRYRTAEEEGEDEEGSGAEEEPAPDPQGPPWEIVDQGSTVPPLLPVAPDRTVENVEAASLGPPSASAPYWQRCRESVRTHLVSCRAARRIAAVATGKLTRPGSAHVRGFDCRLPPGGAQTIVCARRAQRVLAPV
jgi:hypothetical protein